MAIAPAPFTLAPDEETAVAFGIVMGDGLDDMLANAEAMRAAYEEVCLELEECSVSATESTSELPLAFALYQSYPNPFNPSTTVRYDVPEAATIRLVVFDPLGRLVEVLSTKHQTPGTYTVDWSPHSVPSGVYFVRMEAGDFAATRTVILAK
jgi:hypothetical protein